MPDITQHDFRTIELDPDLLSTPFGIQANWHVITGAPSCGKTTLINLLADNGFQTVPEGARLYMEREVAKGRTIDELHADVVTLQRGIKDIRLCSRPPDCPSVIGFLVFERHAIIRHKLLGADEEKEMATCTIV